MVKAEQSNNSCLYPGEVENQTVAQSRRLDNSAVSAEGDELEDFWRIISDL